MAFPMYISLSDIDHMNKEFIRQQKIIEDFVDKYSKEKNFEVVNCTGGTFNIPRMFSYEVNFKNLYNENWYEHRYSDSKIKQYLKYKSCNKKHKEDFVFTKEHVGEFVCSNDIDIKNDGYDIDVVICNNCNIAFNLTDINKGFWNAIKNDLNHILRNINSMWFNITMPIYILMHKKIN
jgi:hypothetical protein